MAHKKYPFYVVLKDSGLVVAGAHYRDDADDMRNDIMIPADLTKVLTATGVVRQYGRVSWASAYLPTRGS